MPCAKITITIPLITCSVFSVTLRTAIRAPTTIPAATPAPTPSAALCP
jgi:hypothetical protein